MTNGHRQRCISPSETESSFFFHSNVQQIDARLFVNIPTVLGFECHREGKTVPRDFGTIVVTPTPAPLLKPSSTNGPKLTEKISRMTWVVRICREKSTAKQNFHEDGKRSHLRPPQQRANVAALDVRGGAPTGLVCGCAASHFGIQFFLPEGAQPTDGCTSSCHGAVINWKFKNLHWFLPPDVSQNLNLASTCGAIESIRNISKISNSTRRRARFVRRFSRMFSFVEGISFCSVPALSVRRAGGDASQFKLLLVQRTGTGRVAGFAEQRRASREMVSL